MLCARRTSIRQIVMVLITMIVSSAELPVRCHFDVRCTCDVPDVSKYYPNTTVSGALCEHMPYDVLKDIPEGTMFFQLYVRDIVIDYLRDDAFLDVKTAVLSLRRNQIKNISGNALRGLEHTLSSLDLSQNHLLHIPHEAFNRIYNLQWLNLYGNYISMVTNSSWGSIPSTIRSLYLGTNRIYSLAPGTFQYFAHLNTLSLEGNLLTSTSKFMAFKYPPNVTTLNLSGNFQTMIPKGIFRLSSISWLFLKDNMIQTLPTESFNGQLVLDELDLSRNFIINLPYNLFGRKLRVRNLHLEYNFLREIPAAAFVGLYPQRLSLSNNLIKKISEVAFQGLSTYLFALDLSYNRLTKVPWTLRQLTHLTELYLQGNQIANIPGDAFSTFIGRLAVLRLSDNELEEVPSLALEGATSLSHLDLDNNRLRTISGIHESWGKSLESLSVRENLLTDLHPGLFSLTPNLRTLKLSRNRFRRLDHYHLPSANVSSLVRLEMSSCVMASLPRQFPRILAASKSLEILVMDGNDVTDLPSHTFSRMTNLRHVDMEWNNVAVLSPFLFRSETNSNLQYVDLSFNVISHIRPGTFRSLPKLEHVVAFGNRIENVSWTAFHDLPSLETIILSHNRIATVETVAFSYLPRIAKLGLQFNNLSTLSLDMIGDEVGSELGNFELNVSWNHIRSLQVRRDDEEPTDLLTIFYVVILDLSHNLVETLSPSFFNVLDKLSRLVLSDNRIWSLNAVTFKSSTRLTFLDLSRNRIRSFPSDALRPLSNVKVLKMSDNAVRNLKSRLNHVTRLKVLDLSSNRLRSFNNVTLGKSRIETLNLNDNDLTKVPSFVKRIASTLINLKLSKNKIDVLRRRTFGNRTSTLNRLDLSYNLLRVVARGAFDDLLHLVSLDISHNPLKTLADELLFPLQSLHVLNMADTSLATIPKLRLPNLRVLDVAINTFSYLPVTSFEGLPSLQSLNISHNRLQYVPTHLWSALGGLHELDISNNPISVLAMSSFDTLRHLLYLDIRNLRLKKFDSRMLNDLPIIRTLKISTYPDVRTFHLHNLLNDVFPIKELWVDVESTRLSHQLRWAFGPKLERLVITGSNLRTLDSGAFEGVQNRHRIEIKLKDTAVQNMPHDVMRHLKNMKRVSFDLRDNRLTSLPRQVFYPVGQKEHNVLKGIEFGNNPLRCDCRITWLGERLRNWSKDGDMKKSTPVRRIDDFFADLTSITCIDPSTQSKLPVISLFDGQIDCVSGQSSNRLTTDRWCDLLLPFIAFSIVFTSDALS